MTKPSCRLRASQAASSAAPTVVRPRYGQAIEQFPRGGPARERRRKTRHALGEDAPITPLVSTPPAPEAGMNNDRRSLCGEITKRSPVSAVARFGPCAASRAEGRLPAVHRDCQSLFAPFDPHDVHACRGRPCNRCFHRPLLPHSVARRQPASIIGSAARGVACTKSQSDPAKMAPDNRSPTGRAHAGARARARSRRCSGASPLSTPSLAGGRRSPPFANSCAWRRRRSG